MPSRESEPPPRDAGAAALPADLLERPAEEAARRVVRARALALAELATARGAAAPEMVTRELAELRALLRALRPSLRGAVTADQRRALRRAEARLGEFGESSHPGRAARRELAALHRLARRVARRVARFHLHRHLDEPDLPSLRTAVGAALRARADELGELAGGAPRARSPECSRDLAGLLREVAALAAAVEVHLPEARVVADRARACLRALPHPGGAAQGRARVAASTAEPEDAGGELLGLAAQTRAACEALARPAPPREIERKFLCRELPKLPAGAEILEVEQGWLPGRTFRERLRRVRGPGGERLVRTLKLGAGAVRVEFEETVDPALFAALWPLTRGARVRKRRYRVPEGGRVFEIDEFLDRDLVLAEVELERPDEPVELPAWLAEVIVREVTDEPGFTNLELARPEPAP